MSVIATSQPWSSYRKATGGQIVRKLHSPPGTSHANGRARGRSDLGRWQLRQFSYWQHDASTQGGTHLRCSLLGSYGSASRARDRLYLYLPDAKHSGPSLMMGRILGPEVRTIRQG